MTVVRLFLSCKDQCTAPTKTVTLLSASELCPHLDVPEQMGLVTSKVNFQTQTLQSFQQASLLPSGST